MKYKLMNPEKEEEIILLRNLMKKQSHLFTEKQIEVIIKRLMGSELTQTEKNYLFNSIKKKILELFYLNEKINIKKLSQDLFKDDSFHRSFNEFKINQSTSIEYDPNMRRILRKLLKSKNIAIITGAGISTGSGLPTYRGEFGMWNEINPEKYLSEKGFKKNPEKTIYFLERFKEQIKKAEPNITHKILAKMDRLFDSTSIITQNIDNYHHKAGSSTIFELHGNIFKTKKKNGKTMPDIRLFGEEINTKQYKYAYNAIMNCDILFIIGTSGYFDYIKKLISDCPGMTIEINPEETRLSKHCDIRLREKAETAIIKIYNTLLKNMIIREFHEKKQDDIIRSIYLYGSILKEKKMPKDIDLLIIQKKEAKDNKHIIKIQNLIRKLTDIKADIETTTMKKLRLRSIDYKKEAILNSTLIYGDNIKGDII